ncbi:putative cytochrome p450 alkane hydroxylase protein [Botrytis fragariae]|uniref:Putative cytochrome p450 alkane hydroxylase protein n=1 Tax=Botrytis fragariae TaxID=1964551 RepID=A0A8H6AXA7_9HELO|nr:putative cytochrome p450 alkane hydroxylase protein [Botrytis fragariae]KAF5875286.1 putative cytochrome p450 alkane hydroxylase protein [Botrytis fragariae]
MHPVTSALLYTVCVSLVVYLRQRWNSYRAFRAAAKQHGCKRVPRYSDRDSIWGTDLMKKRVKAVSEGRQMALFMKHFNEIGKTFEENFFATRVINTIEVHNIQRVRALSFEDYGKSAQNFFKAFLGDGVLSLDGGGPDGKSPIFVEQGDAVALNICGPNHDKDIWGDDVEEFKPQRFNDKRMGWEFTPFLGGPRICPAQQEVLTQSLDTVLEYVEMVRMTTESRNGVKVALFTSEGE